MRLFHYELIPLLDDKHLISQWRECVGIKRQWEKGTLKHRLVSYVKKYDKAYFCSYVVLVVTEMINRNINYSEKLYGELVNFCEKDSKIDFKEILHYPEHDNRYLRQCLYNLEEKFMRGIISKDDWEKIYMNIDIT